MEKKVSIVIPNYNGRNLLLKNLPNVIKYSEGAEVIVVDDASFDDSVELIRKKFKKVKVIRKTKNGGFAQTANLGVLKANGDFILLLNSDVSPRRDFLKIALKNFSQQTFAVGLCDWSHEDNKIIAKGRGGAQFKRGFLNHFPATIEKGETLWVSGGSAIFKKSIFQKVGGFDELYKPFYWEDIDLSFRARRLGYICVFEPFSKVDHFHEEGAILKRHSKFFIKTISYKNQFLFVWKNIDDYHLIILHILWLPYHFVKAILSLDIAFLFGFLKASAQIPALISSGEPVSANYKLTEMEVLKNFAKS